MNFFLLVVLHDYVILRPFIIFLSMYVIPKFKLNLEKICKNHLTFMFQLYSVEQFGKLTHYIEIAYNKFLESIDEIKI
jgi:hypothetical protein